MEAYLDYNKLSKYLGIDLYCKEERQFAVFLYNVFLEKKRRKKEVDKNIDNIVKYCLDVGEEEYKRLVITDVYFEATLMRDYFANCKSPEEKIAFNEELLKFCLGEEDSGKVISKLKKDCLTRNLGQKEAKNSIKNLYPDLENKLKSAIVKSKTVDDLSLFKEIREKSCLDIASMMMNATPDILVLYQIAGEKIYYAKALECKYKSYEGPYKDVAGAKYAMQLFLQECIMGFCFGNGKKLNKIDKNHKDVIETHIPRFPKNSAIWGDAHCKKLKKSKEEYPKYDLWKQICEDVYKEILSRRRESKNVINAGVDMIKFSKVGNNKKVEINDKVSIQIKRIGEKEELQITESR